MPIVTDYASLTQAILDLTHRPTLSTFSDYFIQWAQEEINDDIFAQNFGQGIRLMEAIYPATMINDGIAAVPSDWMAPKLFTVTDTDGEEYGLEFKDPEYIYNRYPNRSATGIPGYIARDLQAAGGTLAAQGSSLAVTATAAQTVFSLASLPTGFQVILVALDGTALFPTSDYSISGTTLTLVNGALAGQKLLVQCLPTSAELSNAGSAAFTATGGQTQFPLGAPAGASVLFATLDGSVLTPGTDYTFSGATLVLANGAAVGQTLLVQYLSTMSASGTSVFIFGPYPDADYTVQGTYYQQAPLLSGSQTTNWMVMNAPSMLLANCMRQAGKFLKDEQMVQGWTQLYNDALAKLILRDTAGRYGAGPLAINVASRCLY